MSRRCEICGKGPHTGNTYTHRGLPKRTGGIGIKVTGKTKRVFRPNLQRVKVKIKGTVKHIRICAKCLRSGKVTKVT